MTLRLALRPLAALTCLAAALATAAAPAPAAAYLGPTAVLAAKDGKSLYVAEADARQIAMVDPAAGKVTRTVRVPGEPTGMVLSPDGGKLYVTCAAPQSTVCVIDLATGRIAASLAAGHTATGAAITPDGKRLYVCNRFNHNVSVLDLDAGKEITRVPVIREPVAAATTPDGKTVFVVNHLPLDRSDSYDVAATVAAIDTATNRVTSTRLPNGSSSMRGICVSPDGKHAYATHILARYQMPTTQLERGWMNTNALSIIDAEAKKLVNTVLLDDVDLGAANPWGVTMTADGKQLCVTHAGTHEVSVIDAPGLLAKLAKVPVSLPPDKPGNIYAASATTTQADVPNDLAFLVDLRRRIKLDGRGPRGIAAIGPMIYAAEYYSDTLGTLDLQSKMHKPTGQIALGPKPVLTPQRRGELLFSDAEICFQHWQSCASCHPDGRADGLNWDLMNDGLGNPKNTRNMLFVEQQGGPAMSLGVRESAEAAVRAGITHILFAVRPEWEARAMDEYLKAMRPVASPYLVAGKLSPAAERGKKIFFDKQVGCGVCHPEPLYTDKKAHDVASAGKYDKPTDKFNTPRLAETWRTAPYMHDGHYLTVKELIVKGKHGAKGGDLSQLSEKDIDDLVEFVLSL